MYRSRTVYVTARRALSLQRSTSCSRVVLSAVLSRSASASAQPEAAASSDDTLKPFSAIPGPKPLPVIGNLLDFSRNSKRLNEFFGECYQKYGQVYKLEAPGMNLVAG